MQSVGKHIRCAFLTREIGMANRRSGGCEGLGFAENEAHVSENNSLSRDGAVFTGRVGSSTLMSGWLTVGAGIALDMASHANL